jgi:hypothetical protein
MVDLKIVATDETTKSTPSPEFARDFIWAIGRRIDAIDVILKDKRRLIRALEREFNSNRRSRDVEDWQKDDRYRSALDGRVENLGLSQLLQEISEEFVALQQRIEKYGNDIAEQRKRALPETSQHDAELEQKRLENMQHSSEASVLQNKAIRKRKREANKRRRR